MIYLTNDQKIGSSKFYKHEKAQIEYTIFKY